MPYLAVLRASPLVERHYIYVWERVSSEGRRLRTMKKACFFPLSFFPGHEFWRVLVNLEYDLVSRDVYGQR
jgi:hypothetical protein